jgi:transcriptional regulator with XRE-family HTH domain
MTTHDEYMQKLSPARRAKIEARTKELIAEEMTLRELRKARELSQETLAEVLNWRQGDLSKFERRADAYLSTIRRYVEAMGGTGDLVASFPNMPAVKIVHIGDLDESSADNDNAEQEERTLEHA